MMVQRIYSRIGAIPGNGLRLNVMVLGYHLYNYISRHFTAHAEAKKIVAIGGTLLGSVVGGRSHGTADGRVAVKEARSACLWKGRGRGVGLTGRDAQIRWALLEDGSFQWYQASTIQVRSSRELFVFR
jgi:hypothetical protein